MSMSLHSQSFELARKWSPIFVETGTHHGGGILGATRANFDRIFTCELEKQNQDMAKWNMGHQWDRVRYYLGDSASCLPQMLKDAGERCSVLLDAHGSGGGYCPLRGEFKALKETHRHDHLVMVDDVDLCGTPHLDGITLEEVTESLLEINRGYTFAIRNGVRSAMLLFALPPGFRE